MLLEVKTDVKSLIDVCKDYWQLNDQGSFTYTVREIADKHSMEAHVVSNLVSKHAYVSFEDICCGSCQVPYHLTSRSEYKSRNLYTDTICQTCSDAEKQALINKKLSIIESIKSAVLSDQKDTQQLTLKDIVFLASAIQALGHDNLSQLTSLADNPSCTLSPESASDRMILRHLIDQRLSWISGSTPLTSIRIQDDDVFNLDLANCCLEIPFQSSDLMILIDKFSIEKYQKEFKQSEEFFHVCSEVQLFECLAFLKYTLSEHQLHFSPGDKTQLAMSQCLRYFSIAQTYSLIWRAVKDSAAYYMRGGIGKRQAANSVVGNISRNMEKALANNWDVMPFRRNYKLPQSTISQLLFNTVLGTDDGGFHYKLSDLKSLDSDISTQPLASR
ncbi:hypothetical protein Q8W30_17260 [Neptunomonas phycophila]|uniref:Uncharacterized protein n=1 Tax=Neptunomonas phycophila TaxID=1572645 RepID=A0ABT9EZ46_9GAMM|nr:hypothetical protein [Neptunomonas phycophila]MDP2524316.1 hypothetical protein [Neptunomonas phycophila]